MCVRACACVCVRGGGGGGGGGGLVFQPEKPVGG